MLHEQCDAKASLQVYVCLWLEFRQLTGTYAASSICELAKQCKVIPDERTALAGVCLAVSASSTALAVSNPLSACM